MLRKYSAHVHPFCIFAASVQRLVIVGKGRLVEPMSFLSF